MSCCYDAAQAVKEKVVAGWNWCRRNVVAPVAVGGTLVLTSASAYATDPLIPATVDTATLMSEATTKIGTILLTALGIAFMCFLAWRAFRSSKKALNNA